MYFHDLWERTLWLTRCSWAASYCSNEENNRQYRVILKENPNHYPESLGTKDRCYASNPRIVADMTKSIKNIVNSISMDMLERVFDNFRKDLDFCANFNGSHFENVYH